MTVVYAVSNGEYSDYRIEAIFTTEERAKEYISAMDGAPYDAIFSSERRIEEYELDEFSDFVSRGLSYFRVEFESVHQGDTKPRRSLPEKEDREHLLWRGQYECFVWAKDEASALKIANEKRVQYAILHNL